MILIREEKTSASKNEDKEELHRQTIEHNLPKYLFKRREEGETDYRTENSSHFLFE